jgi:hypothetical protein
VFATARFSDITETVFLDDPVLSAWQPPLCRQGGNSSHLIGAQRLISTRPRSVSWTLRQIPDAIGEGPRSIRRGLRINPGQVLRDDARANIGPKHDAVNHAREQYQGVFPGAAEDIRLLADRSGGRAGDCVPPRVGNRFAGDACGEIREVARSGCGRTQYGCRYELKSSHGA